MDVYTYEFWAQSVTDKALGTEIPVKQNVTKFKTVYLAHRPYGPKATAQICLSRLDGSGTAKAIVYGYSFFFQDDPDPLYVFPGSYSGPTDSMAIVLDGPGSVTMNNAHSITFQIGVSNMFAYATATIFVEPVSIFSRLVTAATAAVRNLERISSAQPNGITHVAYDRRSGQLLSTHESVTLPGVPLPGGAELARIAGTLVDGSPVDAEHVAVTSAADYAARSSLFRLPR